MYYAILGSVLWSLLLRVFVNRYGVRISLTITNENDDFGTIISNPHVRGEAVQHRHFNVGYAVFYVDRTLD